MAKTHDGVVELKLLLLAVRGVLVLFDLFGAAHGVGLLAQLVLQPLFDQLALFCLPPL